LLFNRAEAGEMSHEHRVIIVGGGYGGLRAARALKAAPVDVTLIGRRNFHLFQSLLYQVATGSLSRGEIAAPLRSVLRRQRTHASFWAKPWTSIPPQRSSASRAARAYSTTR
jgi:NADH dehydrogenase FAD-containing subunit